MYLCIMHLVILLRISSCFELEEQPICNICHCLNSVVDCSERSLTYIPTDIPRKTRNLILAQNRIQVVPDFIFNGTELLKLDLSHNMLTNVSYNSLYGLHNLKSLTLRNNSIYMEHKSYPNGVFRHLNELKHLDISENFIPNHLNLTYPHQIFSDLVSLETLKLDGIPDLTFGEGFIHCTRLKYLNVSGNCKTVNVFDKSFQYLPNLEVLVVSKCRLRNIGALALSGFKNLVYMDLSYNRQLGFDNACLPFKKLESLKFNILDLSAIEGVFAVGVTLKSIHLSSMKHLNITHVYLDNNRIEYVETSAMSQVPPTIQKLSFRYNRPTFGLYLLCLDVLQNVVFVDASYQYVSGIPFGPYEDSSSISPYEDTYSIWPYEDTSSISPSSRDFSLDTFIVGNYAFYKQRESMIIKDKRTFGIDKFDIPANDNLHSILRKGFHGPIQLPPMLRKANGSRSKIGYPTIIKDKRKFGIDNFDIPDNENLHSILRKGFHGHIKLPQTLRKANGSRSKLGYPLPKLQFDTNHVMSLDLSVNLFNTWKGPILGLKDLEWLDLSNNYCEFISDVFFSDFPNLQYLSISSNFIADSIEKDINGYIFQNMSKLTICDISDNRIRYFPPKLFHGQRQLKRLLMSNNPTKVWTLAIYHMLDLEYIDLSYNLLSSLPPSFRNFCDEQHRKNKTVSVNLLGQTVRCTCDNLDFLIWMSTKTTNFTNSDKYKCTDSKGSEMSLQDIDEIILQLQKQCASYTELIVILSFGVIAILTLIVGGVIYRYRWKLRYLYYLTRSKYRGYSAIGGATLSRFDFDAFVSYADEDRRIVVSDMVRELEQKHGTQLCIHHRDFLVGEVIAANILNAVRNSRKTLILLSRNFLASYWCIYELNMAHLDSLETGRNVLIVIIYEHIPVRELPEVLVNVMKNDSYIEYTDDPEGNIVFWDKLERAIKAD